MASEEESVFQTWTRRHLNRESGFAILLALMFLGVGTINILSHEMWRDELQAWLSAKNSSSIASLFDNIRYDGHPGLWPVILYFLSRFSDRPIIMQLFHLVVATATAYVFAKYSPFTKLQKILFVFGYFPLYEYATISRNYGLGIFLIFVFCTAFRTRFKNYLMSFFILFVLTQTSVYGLMIAASFGLILVFEGVTQNHLQKTAATGKLKVVVALFIFIFGIGSSISQLILPPDSGFAVGWRTSSSLLLSGETLATLWKGYVPIPTFTYHFWNSNIITSVWLQALLGCMFLCLSCLLLLKKPKALILYSVGSFAILAFTYVKYLGRVRHHGHLFILFIACLWISNHYSDKEFRLCFADKLVGFMGRYRNSLITLILCAHLIAGMFASGMDWVYPFSVSKEVAKFITEKGMKDMPILGYRDSLTSAVSGHLNRSIYYPNSDRFGSFLIFDQKRLREITDEEVLEKAQNLILGQKRDGLLVLSHRLNELPYPVVMLREFDAGIVQSETYSVYLMRYDRIREE